MRWGLAIAVTLALCLAMALAWTVQRVTRNCGWVDAIWSAALGLAGMAYALLPAGALTPHRLLVAVLVLLWSLRLAAHLAWRSASGPEDARYAHFRTLWGARFEPRLFAFLQIQALAAALLALAMAAAARNPAPPGWRDGLGVAILLLSVLGAGLADRQLARFRANPANAGRICDAGLWRLSRHPNYFFEFLGWLAWPVLAFDPAAPGWSALALAGPAFIYWLLVHVSGIPPLEAHMARSRGSAWAAYRARTRPFLPIPR